MNAHCLVASCGHCRQLYSGLARAVGFEIAATFCSSLQSRWRCCQLAVSSAPCGHCRRFCWRPHREFQASIAVILRNALQDDLLISFPAHAGSLPQEHTLDQLLPQRFGPVDLLEESSTPLLLQPQVRNPDITQTTPASLRS